MFNRRATEFTGRIIVQLRSRRQILHDRITDIETWRGEEEAIDYLANDHCAFVAVTLAGGINGSTSGHSSS